MADDRRPPPVGQSAEEWAQWEKDTAGWPEVVPAAEPPRPVEHFIFGKGEFGVAWVFVWMARDRGWNVGDPRDNTFGYPHVDVWSKGEG